ncbi:MAG: MgtC/SapB family protein [Lachnospiraceae bacterium]|nr:MgtC/SapB family protein [Lachnospiraceae bacterium]
MGLTIEYLRELNLLSICLRIILSLIIGGILGLERGRKNRPAGFRTYILVCLGSTIVMMTNQYVYQVFGASDPTRMGAQVISGIGFLGAGTIMVTGRQQIKGITTAAGMWSAACCGLAIGIGFYEGAIAGGIIVFLIMEFLEKMDGIIRRHSNIMDVYLEFDGKKMFSTFLSSARENGFDVSNIQISKNKHVKTGELSVVLTLESQTKRTQEEMLSVIGSVEGVSFIEKL